MPLFKEGIISEATAKFKKYDFSAGKLGAEAEYDFEDVLNVAYIQYQKKLDGLGITKLVREYTTLVESLGGAFDTDGKYKINQKADSTILKQAGKKLNLIIDESHNAVDTYEDTYRDCLAKRLEVKEASRIAQNLALSHFNTKLKIINSQYPDSFSGIAAKAATAKLKLDSGVIDA